MKKLKVSVSVVLPNWNGVYLMEKHLRRVIEASPGAEIIVSDDHSSDESVSFLRTHFPKVTVVARQTHDGFSGNVDSGVARATGDIVILLNTDVEPEKGYLEPLLSHFADDSVFAVGCLEKSHEKEGIVLRGRGVARWEKGYFIHSRGEVTKTDTMWVSGGSGAFRRSMWEKLGGMDTLFNPFYWEDIDLSYRARKSGWKTLFETKSVVHHYHEEGKIKREFTPADVKEIVYRNQFIFHWKNMTDPALWVSHIFWTPVRIIQSMIAGDFLMIKGFFRAVSRIGEIMKHRQSSERLFTLSDEETLIR